MREYRTDENSYIDLLLSDRQLARVYVSYTDYPATINGIDVQDVFEGVFKAG